MQDEISFGNWLRKQRRTLDLSRQAFANQVGCAEVTLRRIEAGTLKPSKDLAQTILEKLGVPKAERPQWLSFARGLAGFPLTSSSSSSKQITNLPSSLTSFIGRENEQLDVNRLISKFRLVTLTGPGGVGKTRLAIRVGEEALGNYADGVWLVEFAPVLDLVFVPRVTAIAIGLHEEPQRPVADMLSDFLREKNILIILDNCEHLLDACAQLADTLLKRCPGLKILATSREAFGILGEAIYPVPSLALPEMYQLLESFRSYASVRLFEERAQLARREFSLTPENLSSVAEICSQLDGIPLAIELAAARVKMFSTEQIAARLQERFRLLSTGNRTAPPRHQTLQAAIDWSYNLLSPVEKSIFQRLSVFIHGWTLDAAESICSDETIASDDILHVLTNLTNKSLVIVEEKHVGTRYRMLETIRQYANEKLIESGEKDEISDRHLDYFLRLAETAGSNLMQAEQLEWLPVLDADYENWRLAFEWSLNKETTEFALKLCNALWWFWKIRGRWLEGLDCTRKALAKSSQTQNVNEKVARVRAFAAQAALEWHLGNFKQMLLPAQQSLLLASEAADKKDVAIARFYMGIALARQGEDYDRALSLLEQSVAELRALREEFWDAYFDSYLSELLAAQAQRKLHDRFVRSLALARKIGERVLLADVLSHYATWLFTVDQLEKARACAEEADRLFQQLGIRRPGERSFVLAAIAWLESDTQKARGIYTKMQERCSLLGEKHYRSISLSQLGLLAMEEGDLLRAQEYLEQGLLLSREAGSQVYSAMRLMELGNLFYLLGNKEAFRQNVREAFSLREYFLEGHKVLILEILLGPVYLGKPEDSVRILGAIAASETASDLVPAEPITRLYCGRAKAHARNVLGDSAFEALLAEGQKMSLDEGLDLALKSVEEI
jgi:predicted ATPase/DNA-binding XRE family transcriptional regulator